MNYPGFGNSLTGASWRYGFYDSGHTMTVLEAMIPRKCTGMVTLIRWLYLNLRYRVSPLPKDPATLEQLAMDLRIPLAFTYRANGLDMKLAQQRIHESLNSFQWIAPLVIAGLCFALIVILLF